MIFRTLLNLCFLFILLGFPTLAISSPAAPAVTALLPAPFESLAKGGKGGWLNVDKQLTPDVFKGRLVLLDFWTYGCINCMQTVPELKALEKKFGDKVLVIGVHSAKFENEKDTAKIVLAARRFNLTHPVINDSDFAIWNEYKVKAWPTLVLLGTDGQEISRYSGEGHGADLDRDISNAITTVSKNRAALPRARSDTRKDRELWFPARIIVANDQLYIANSGFNKITITDKSGKIQTTIGSGKEGFDDGSYDKATFNQPRGLALIGSKLYIADTGNHALREVDLMAKKVTTLSGNGVRGHVYDVKNAPAKGVELASPWDVDVMKDGKTLVIAMAGLHQLWTYDTKEKTVSVLAGNGYEKIEDGPSVDASLAQPSGVSVLGGVVYFVDAESSSLREVKDGKVRTLIGSGLFDFGFEDGGRDAAKLQHPQGVLATKDKIYIADTYNNAIRVYGPAAQLLSTYKVTGPYLLEPGDVAVSGSTLFVADTSHHLIKKVDLKTGAITALEVRK